MFLNKTSIFARLDSRYIYNYVCEEDKDSDSRTIFKLKNLSVSEYKECEGYYLAGFNLGQFTLTALRHGLVGWDNFAYEDGEVIPFDFVNFSAIALENQVEISETIFNMASVEEEIENNIKLILKWSRWLDNAKNKTQWDCEYCNNKNLSNARNCDGLHTYKCNRCGSFHTEPYCDECKKQISRANFVFRWSTKLDDFSNRCPIALLDPLTVKLVNIVNYCNDSHAVPFSGGAMEQTNFYYHLRTIVLSEQNAMLKAELDKDKNKNKPSPTTPSRGMRNVNKGK